MDDHFSKIIKEVLSNPPDFPFDENTWKTLEKKLHSRPDRGNRIWTWGIPVAFLLWLMPATLLWISYNKLDDARSRIKNMETLLHSQKAIAADTLVRHHVTIVYDTIYRTVAIEKKTPKPAGLTASHPYVFYPGKNYLSGSFSPSRRLVHSPLFSNILMENLFFPKNNSSIINKIKSVENLPIRQGNAPAIKPQQLSAFPPPAHPELAIHTPPYFLKKKKKNLRYFIYKMQPRRLAIQANYGIVDVLGFGPGKKDIATGIRFSSGYGNHLHLFAGVEYLQWEFKKELEDDDQDIVAQYPAISPKSPEDQIHEIFGQFKYLQIPVGMEYIFYKQKNWQPFIGIGLVYQKSIRAKLGYDFLSPTDGEYDIYRTSLLPKTFHLQSARATIGVQYALQNHWLARFAASTQFDIEKGKYRYQQLQIFQLHGGLKYRF